MESSVTSRPGSHQKKNAEQHVESNVTTTIIAIVIIIIVVIVIVIVIFIIIIIAITIIIVVIIIIVVVIIIVSSYFGAVIDMSDDVSETVWDPDSQELATQRLEEFNDWPDSSQRRGPCRAGPHQRRDHRGGRGAKTLLCPTSVGFWLGHTQSHENPECPRPLSCRQVYRALVAEPLEPCRRDAVRCLRPRGSA